jgi:integrase
MARRGHGEGSIYQRKDGRWTAAITLENRKRKTFYGKSRKEVQEQLKRALHEQQQGTLATGPHQTVKAFLLNWMEDVHKQNIRLGSQRTYMSLLKNHILPEIGHIPLQKLTAQQVQALCTRKLKSGLSVSMISGIHALLHKALDQAVKWRLISNNVCDAVSVPTEPPHENHPLTPEQAKKLLEAAKNHRLEALLTVALATGMRKGELLSLQWADVDFEDMSLQVKRTFLGKYKGENKENEPKSASGRRSIPLAQFAVDVLKQHRIRQLEERLQIGDAWIDRDLVFCKHNGDFFALTTFRTWFKALLKEAGLPDIRFHDLRHSAATILLSMGVDMKVIQQILGHSNYAITANIYSHVLPSMSREASQKMDDAFRKQSR